MPIVALLLVTWCASGGALVAGLCLRARARIVRVVAMRCCLRDRLAGGSVLTVWLEPGGSVPLRFGWRFELTVWLAVRCLRFGWRTVEW